MSIGTPPPSADAQLVFLTKLQRLFAEGDFTATYKFALLIVLADLAVELGSDNGDSLELTTRQIGDRFIQLYWSHTSPYVTSHPGTAPGVLIQNNGAQASVVSAIENFRARTLAASPLAAAKHPEYASLQSNVTQTVSAQPLTYLQNFGGGTDEFLYERPTRGRVRLKSGVAYCFRRFQPLLQEVARSHWVKHIKNNRRNHSILGVADDLEQFLFETSRQSLAFLAIGLRQIDGNNCFYCGGALNKVDVDHFIPFSLYPRDLIHNFVLAHPVCNRSKSAMLAGKQHLERWLERLARRGDDMADVGMKAGLVVDAEACRRVVTWGYSNAYSSGATAWVAPSAFEPIDGDFLRLVMPPA
ncbi:hypothetical protein D9M69_460930 [compost metagenome]